MQNISLTWTNRSSVNPFGPETYLRNANDCERNQRLWPTVAKWASTFGPLAPQRLERGDTNLALERRGFGQRDAARILEVCDDLDVRSLLPSVAVPTIVFDSDRDQVVAVDEGRILAVEIPNAKFVPLWNANHLPPAEEPAWRKFLEELAAFLHWRGDPSANLVARTSSQVTNRWSWRIQEKRDGDVFPNGTIWASDHDGKGSDMMMLGEKGPIQINVVELQQRLDRPEYAGVAQSLREVGLDSAVEILGTYAGQASDLKPWLFGADMNRDRNLRLQYLAGMAVDDKREGVINAEMMVFRRFPVNLFVGSDQDVSALRLRPGWR